MERQYLAIELYSYLSIAQLISLPCPEPLYFLLIYFYSKTYEQDFVGTRNTVQRLNKLEELGDKRSLRGLNTYHSKSNTMKRGRLDSVSQVL